MKRFLIFLSCLFTIFFVNAQTTLTPELLWQFERIGEFKVSPDGSQVIFTSTKYDLAENMSNADIYIMSIHGGNPRRLTALAGSESNISWSSDGKKVTFLSSAEGDNQLWEMNIDGSGQRKISSVTGGISNVRFSPDMSYVYYTRDVKLEPTVNELYPDLPKANARIIDDLMYRHWDEWQDYKYSHLFVAEYKNGQILNEKDLMNAEPFDTPLKPFGGAEQIVWSPDGKYIAYTSKKVTGKAYAISTNSEIYLYNLATGSTEIISTGLKGYDKNPVFSPDGKKLAWNSMEREGYESDRNRIMVYDFSKKKTEEITRKLDRNAEIQFWSEDGDKIYFISGERATEQIFEINVKSGKTKQLTRGNHNYTHLEKAGNFIVGSRMSMSAPVELFKYDIKNDVELQLTFINKAKLDQLRMGRVVERTVKTTDNKDMLVWVIYPPDFDSTKQYPTLLYCQGGPQSTVSQFFSYRWNFQLMAANGYIVVAPNRRGLPSFGSEWNEQISGDWGGQAMKDYLLAIDDVSKESYVDANRLGAVGASYGGYSVYWLAGNHNNRFKTFVSHCGLFNLESWYGTTEEMFFANYDLKGPYWDPQLKDSYDKFSPHQYVQNWNTPILVIHGEKDFRVPVSEGVQAFQAAKLRDIPARFLYFPEEGHWVLKPQNGVLWHRVFFDWLDKYLKEPESKDENK